jgi:putative SOS response-associated peptidase YedK
LIPNWAKSLKIPPYFNARADKLPGNKIFWPSISQRALIPMTAFYEWAENDKQPYYIFTQDTPLFYTAGLWNQWQSPDGETIDSCTIITTQPNDTLADIHIGCPSYWLLILLMRGWMMTLNTQNSYYNRITNQWINTL